MRPDVQLRRLERDAVVACLGMAVVAFAASGGQVRLAVAVLGGGLLIAISYLTIASSVTAFAELAARPRGEGEAAPLPAPSAGRTVFRVTTRYALLALLAYVMIARLRLHPVGLLAGASSVVAAAALEVVRLLK